VLAVNHEQAEIDACKLEHLLSSEIGKRLLDFLDFLFSEDPRAAAFLAAFQSNLAKFDERR
jgi:Mn-dependent DtxR family transcriptional regulator